MSKLNNVKIAYEKLPREDDKKLFTKLYAYGNMKLASKRKGKPMQKKKSTKNRRAAVRSEANAVLRLFDVATRFIVVWFLLEPFFMQESPIIRSVMGFAMAFVILPVGVFVWDKVIKPVAAAITEG